MRRLLPLLVLTVAAAGMLAGCSGDPGGFWIDGSASVAPPPSTIIVPDTPRAVIDALGHAMNNRDFAQYRQLFTDDYEFAFAVTDSAGSAFPGRLLRRELELQSANHLFVTGTSSLPPALKIVLTMDRTFIPEPDSRPGKTFPFHQEVKRNFVLSVDTGDQFFRLTGAIRFFLVRGDSAAIPPDLAAEGVHPDASRWWIERWEDESTDSPAAPNDAPTPTKNTTWASLKVLYL